MLLALLPISTFAQDAHLSFKGLPITGVMSEFVPKHVKQGYTVMKESDTHTALVGSFAGFEDCTIIVLCSPISKTVWKVGVRLPEQSSWYSVESRYKEMKTLFTSKYGASVNHYEFFSRPYYEGDGYELQAVSNDKGTYISFWDRPGGGIIVEISASSNSRGWISIQYEDNTGGAVLTREKQSLVSDDI